MTSDIVALRIIEGERTVYSIRVRANGPVKSDNPHTLTCTDEVLQHSLETRRQIPRVLSEPGLKALAKTAFHPALTMPSMKEPRSPRPPGSSTKTTFNLASSSSSDSDNDDAPLPFPVALPRADFLAKDFRPAEYLSALPHRHQTLEDLRAELRERSAAISAELLELVNGNYTAFLSLGNELKGGG